jgi:hypothetical protein
MRQVGDQLIPVGITSGRVVALPPGSEGTVVVDEGSGSRRRRRGERNGPNPDFQQLLGQMTMGGNDIEEASDENACFEKKMNGSLTTPYLSSFSS